MSENETMTVKVETWIFSVVDYDDCEHFLGENGEEVDESEAYQFTGDDTAAREMAYRLAVCWEELTGGIALKFVNHAVYTPR